MSKQKSKYNRNTDSESDPDDPPLQLDEDSHIKSEPKISIFKLAGNLQESLLVDNPAPIAGKYVPINRGTDRNPS